LRKKGGGGPRVVLGRVRLQKPVFFTPINRGEKKERTCFGPIRKKRSVGVFGKEKVPDKKKAQRNPKKDPHNLVDR